MICRGEATHRVGDTGPGGYERDSNTARHSRIRVRGVDYRGFVSHVDQAYVGFKERIHDRVHVPASQAEDCAHVESPQCLDDQFSAVRWSVRQTRRSSRRG